MEVKDIGRADPRPRFGDLRRGTTFYHDGALCMRVHKLLKHDCNYANYVNLESGYWGDLAGNRVIIRVKCEALNYRQVP